MVDVELKVEVLDANTSCLINCNMFYIRKLNQITTHDKKNIT